MLRGFMPITSPNFYDCFLRNFSMSGSVWYLSFSKKKIGFKKYPKEKKSNNSKRKTKKNFIIFLMLFTSLVFFSSLVSAAAINDTLHLNLQTTDGSGDITTGTFAFGFNITNNSDSACLSSIVYNHSVSQATDDRGIVSIYLPTSGSEDGNLSALDYNVQYYLCYYRDGTLKSVSQLGRVPYAFRATQVNLSEVTVDSNLNLADNYNITDVDTGFFSFLGTLLERIGNIFATDVNISNNLTVGGNITFDGLIFGNGSQLTDISSATLDGYDSSYFMPLNTSVVGDFDITGSLDVDGDWASGGVTIDGGDIYAQTIYVYNITSLDVTQQNLTINDDFLVFGNSELMKNLTVDTDTLFVDSSTDMVGIGTSSPEQKLGVSGNIGTTGDIKFTGSGSTADFTFTSTSGATNFVTFKSTGTITSGDSLLQIGDSVGTFFRVLFDGNIYAAEEGVSGGLSFTNEPLSNHITFNKDNNVEIKTQARTDGASTVAFTLDTANALTTAGAKLFELREAGVGVLTVDKDGNVGIGTVSPGGKLHINATSMNDLVLDAYAGSPDIIFAEGGSQKVQVFYDVTNHQLRFLIDDAGSVTTGDEKMVIGNDGNVGIGTTAPTALLNINTSNTTAAFHVQGRNATGTTVTQFYIENSSGNVGIGTNSPSEVLDVAGIGRFTEGLAINPSGATDKGVAIGREIIPTQQFVLQESATSVVMNVIDTTATINYFTIKNGGEIVMNGGNVGIGLVNPVATLHINSSNPLGALHIENTTGSDLLFVNGSSGNVGIGTTSPINLLEINGSLGMYTNLGSDKVTNGEFTGNADGWTVPATEWTYNSNAVDKDGDGTTALEQDVSAVANEIYKVVYNFSSRTVGSVIVSIGGASTTAKAINGVYTEYITATDTSNLKFTPSNTARFTIDGVSVEKVGSSATDHIVTWIDDTGAVAGKAGLYIGTEDGTTHVFGDNVGIGTTDPGTNNDATLDVYGPGSTSTVTTALAIQNPRQGLGGSPGVDANGVSLDFILRSDTNAQSQFMSGRIGTVAVERSGGNLKSAITFSTRDSNTVYERMRIGGLDSAPLIGIGTTTPQNTLNVVGDANISGQILTGETALTQFAHALATTSGMSIDAGGSPGVSLIGNNKVLLKAEDGGNNIYFAPGGTEAVRIITGGNVGINTTTPQNKLNVVGDLNVTGTIYGPGGANITGDYVPYTGATQNVDLGDNNFTVNGTTLHVSTNTGRVGINDTTPDALLDVGGTLRVDSTSSYGNALSVDGGSTWTWGAGYGGILKTTGATVLGLGTNNNNDVMVLNGSNVGIGTASPDAKLDVFGTTDFGIKISSDTTDADTWLTFQESSVDAMKILYNGTNNEMIIRDEVGDADLVTIERAGNVGIGVTDPDAKLELKGASEGVGSSNGILSIQTASTNGLRFGVLDTDHSWIQSYGGLPLSINPVGNNVGIGTVSPSSLLHLKSTTADVEFRIDATTNNDSIINFRENAVDRGSIYWDGNANDFVWSSTFGDISLMPLGNVGINTSTPQNTLNVVGDLNVTGTIYGLGGANITGDYVPYTGATSNVVLGNNNLSVGGTDFFVDNDNGRVGIGTSSPSSKLHVNGSSTGNIELQVENIDTGTAARSIVRLRNDASSAGLFYHGSGHTTYARDLRIINNDAAGDIIFFFNGADNMVLAQDGNVGIGTTSPATKLEVSGAGAMVRLNSPSATDSRIEFNRTGLREGLINWDRGELRLQADGNFTDSNLTFFAGGSERVRITSSGNVGIGTTAPATELEIYKASTPGPTLTLSARAGATQDKFTIQAFDTKTEINHTENTDAALGYGLMKFTTNADEKSSNPERGGFVWITNSSIERMRITNMGNVGIGTASPSEQLTIHEGTDNATLRFNASSGANAIWDIRVGDSIGPSAGNSFGIWGGIEGSETNRLVIDASGNVGIGDSTPGEELEVAGDINATGGDICITGGNCLSTVSGGGGGNSSAWNRSGTDVFLANTGDNVGIGTASPSRVLDVVGDMNLASGASANEVVGGLTLAPSLVIEETSGRTGIVVTNENDFLGAAENNSAFQYVYSGGDADVSTKPVLMAWHNQTGTLTNYLNLDADGNGYFAGNVGIGTASPAAKFHVQTTASNIIAIFNNSNGQMQLQSDGTQNFLYSVNADNTGYEDFAIKTGATATFYVESTTGDVGIGTASPDNKLEVVGMAQFSHTDGAGDHLIIQPWTDGDIYFNAYGAGAGEGGFVFRTADGTNPSFQIGSDTVANTLVLDGTGVGIGTVSPNSLLQVGGDSDTQDNIFSIGTSGNYNKSIDFRRAGSIDWQIMVDGLEDFRIRGLRSDEDFYIEVNDSGTMITPFFIDSSNAGNVGIGTITPQNKLNVIGAINATGTVYANGAALTSNTGTVTGVTGTTPIVSSGGTTPAISLTLLKDVVATTPLLVNGVAAVNNILPGADADLTFSMPAATASVNGYMTSTFATKLNSIATGAQTGTVTSIATTAPLAGGTITTSGTLSITADGIGDTQLAFNTGQHLTTTNKPQFAGANIFISPLNDSIEELPSAGVFAQAGPGSSNDVGWDYPYGTKLSVVSSNTRNFEMMITTYPTGDMVYREYNVTASAWTDWRKLWSDYNDGSGSGLDADLLDGSEGSVYLDNTDTQDLGTSGNTITLTNSPSITAPYATNAGTLDGIDSLSFLRSDASDTTTGSLTVDGVVVSDELRERSGQQLILNAGESSIYATGQTSEYIYLNAETGIQVVSSPDNWATGWAGRDTTLISGTAISVDGNTVYHAGNDPLDTIAEWDSLCTDCVGNDDIAAGAVDLTSDALSTAYAGTGILGGGSSALGFDCSEVEGTGIDCATEAITLDATGDWTGTLDTLEAADFLRSNAADTLSATMKVDGGSIIHDEGSIAGYISHPDSAAYSQAGSSATGAIRICMPFDVPNDMIRFTVDVFDYTTDESFTANIAGYAYQTAGGNEWVSPSATIIADNTNRDFTIRFGHEGGVHCVYIGETGSTWSYPQVVVRDFYGGYNTDIDQWDDGWTIAFDTSFSNVDETQSNNFPVARYATTAGGAPPTGTAGGGLSGTYPNPGVDDTDCAAESVLMGDGVCDTKASFGDGTGTDDQTCAEVSGCVVGATTNTGTVTSVATGNGISGGTITTSGTLTVAGGTCLTQDAGGLSVTALCISDAQIAQNTIDATELAANAVGDSELIDEIYLPNGVRIGADAANNEFDDASGGTGSIAMYIGNQRITTENIDSVNDADSNIGNEYPIAGTDIDVSTRTVSLETTLDSVDIINELQFLDFAAGNDYEIRWWGGSDSYTISMGNDQSNHGTVTDYSMHFNMGTTANRGFTFGSSNTAVAASINALTGDAQFGDGSGTDITVGPSATGKIDAATFDPLYTINNITYATYLPGMAGGVKEEVTGTVMLNSDYTIDFKNLEVGSDLWLFYQVTDFGVRMENLQIMLTPAFNGKVWYEKNPSEKTLKIHGTKAGEVSYRLTANRHDWGDWSNLADSENKGFILGGK